MNIDSHIIQANSDPAPPAPLDSALAGRLAELFGALSDTNRLRILSVLLHGEAHVQEISEQTGMSHSAVSHQLRGLRQMRMVRARKQGRLVFYCMDDDHAAALIKLGLDHLHHD